MTARRRSKRRERGQPSDVRRLDETAGDVDLAIEAVVEKVEIKGEVIRALDRLCPVRTIIAFDTSPLLIATLAAMTKRPGKFAGMHFFNPAPVMNLVESQERQGIL